MPRIVLAAAGLFGALGTLASAGWAHGEMSRNLLIVAAFLLVHGAALAGFAALLAQHPSRVLSFGLLAMILGVGLFGGDLAWRDFRHDRLFPMAAPVGGVLVILGWLATGASAILRRD